MPKNKKKKIQNGSQDGGQDSDSKLELPITEPFINRFGSTLIRMHIKSAKKKKLFKIAAKMAAKTVIKNLNCQ